MQHLFTSIYLNNGWSGKQSRSGTGSDLEQTEEIRRVLPMLFEHYQIMSLLDIPCGDYWWFSHIKNLPEFEYYGADIVEQLIHDNRAKYPGVHFAHLDITRDELYNVDMIMARDVLGHFSQKNVDRAIANMRASGSHYLLTTTFPGIQEQRPDIETGSWRPINMELILGPPLELIDEKLFDSMGQPVGKYLGVWELNRD